jgi:hypothetical protein
LGDLSHRVSLAGSTRLAASLSTPHGMSLTFEV